MLKVVKDATIVLQQCNAMLLACQVLYLRCQQLSPKWTLQCVLRFPFWLKPRPQMEQQYGFSPVWISSCRSSLQACGNSLPHTEQWYSIFSLGFFRSSGGISIGTQIIFLPGRFLSMEMENKRKLQGEASILKLKHDVQLTN